MLRMLIKDITIEKPGNQKRLLVHIIADQLNREGQASAKGLPYTVKIVQWIRCRYRIPPAELKRPEELTVRQDSAQ